jgi:hypothetical protein
MILKSELPHHFEAEKIAAIKNNELCASRRRAVLPGSLSTQIRSLPISAKQTPVANPTQPVPKIELFIAKSPVRQRFENRSEPFENQWPRGPTQHLNAERCQLKRAGLQKHNPFFKNAINLKRLKS